MKRFIALDTCARCSVAARQVRSDTKEDMMTVNGTLREL